jgi:putative membrane protein
LRLWLAIATSEQSPDESFYEDAWQGNLAEIQQGELAETKGQSQAVKDFGAMMVKDHTDENAKLKTIAARKGVDLPSTAGVKQEGNRAKLELLSGYLFDKSYIKGMVKDHRDDIEAFQTEVQSGKDADARGYAQAALPTLEAHLRKIEGIAKAAGISAD